MKIDREESMFLTMSGNHRRRDLPEFIQIMSEPYREAGGMMALYEGVILGGADSLFGLEELTLWIRRHKFAAYDLNLLIPITHMCLEYAVRTRLSKERPGLPNMASLAAKQLLKEDPLLFRHASRYWTKIYWLSEEFPEAACEESRQTLRQFDGFPPIILENFLRWTRESGKCTSARSLVEQAVVLYKEIFTKYFAPDHSQDLMDTFDYTKEVDMGGDHGDTDEYIPKDQAQMELRYDGSGPLDGEGILLTEEELAAVPEYIAKNFGSSFKTRKEMDEITGTLCTEIHEKRKLLFTDGLPESAYEEDNGRGRALKASRDANLQMVVDHEDSVRQGIRSIELAFRNALNLKNDPEIYKSDRGILVNSSLWKVGRVENPRLFHKILRQENTSLVVELLIDASGSQMVRQPMVAMQSYMFSAALSRIGIPHRVLSYCTYGDHTVLRRFRDYEDGQESDRKILTYQATSNNRDGLALAAAGVDLRKRKEENKIVIVFSDGLPNDMVAGRVRAGDPKKYIGEAAVQDTCNQVRLLRREGIRIIGIFLGNDQELLNERKIYGTSFVRIRRVEDFSGTAGRRLSEALADL